MNRRCGVFVPGNAYPSVLRTTEERDRSVFDGYLPHSGVLNGRSKWLGMMRPVGHILAHDGMYVSKEVAVTRFTTGIPSLHRRTPAKSIVAPRWQPTGYLVFQGVHQP